MTRCPRSIVLLVVASFLNVACESGEGGDVVVQTVSEYGGTPIEGVRVQVNEENWVATDSDGNAAFPGVEPPYSVRIFQTTEAGDAEHHDVWELIERTERRLVVGVDGSIPQLWNTAVISGTVTGATEDSVAVVAVFAAANGVTESTGADMDGGFTFSRFTWEGERSQELTFHAFEIGGSSSGIRYHKHAARSATVSDPDGSGGRLSDVELELGPVTESHVTGAVTFPSDLPRVRSSLWLEFTNGVEMSLGGDDVSSGLFDIPVPDLKGATVLVGADATAPSPGRPYAGYSHARRKSAIPAQGLELDLPDMVVLDSPDEGATIDGSTVFRWSAPVAAESYALHVACEPEDGGSLNYRTIQSAGTEAVLPEIPDLLVPSGAPCVWRVVWFEGPESGPESTAVADEVRFSISAERTATLR